MLLLLLHRNDSIVPALKKKDPAGFRKLTKLRSEVTRTPPRMMSSDDSKRSMAAELLTATDVVCTAVSAVGLALVLAQN